MAEGRGQGRGRKWGGNGEGKRQSGGGRRRGKEEETGGTLHACDDRWEKLTKFPYRLSQIVPYL